MDERQSYFRDDMCRSYTFHLGVFTKVASIPSFLEAPVQTVPFSGAMCAVKLSDKVDLKLA